MNPYKFKVSCSVCGGEGLGTLEALRWDGSLKHHKDPRVCIENLKKKK